MMAEVFGYAGGTDYMFLIFVIALGVPLWAIVDALSRPATAFYGAGSNKTAWIIVLAVTTWLGLGLLLGAYYLIAVRRRVRDQSRVLRGY